MDSNRWSCLQQVLSLDLGPDSPMGGDTVQAGNYVHDVKWRISSSGIYVTMNAGTAEYFTWYEIDERGGGGGQMVLFQEQSLHV